MGPSEATAVVHKLLELFPGISQAECRFLESAIEKYPASSVTPVIGKYAEEAANFDRVKFLRLVRDEHSSRTPTQSPTRKWKQAKEEEKKKIDESLDKLPKRRLKELLDAIEKKRPDLRRMLRSDLLQTDIGRSLVYEELRTHEK
jgi:hypothetical protein